MLDLFDQLARAFFGDADEIRYIELDMAFLSAVNALYPKAEADTLFGLYLKVFDHVDPQPLTSDEQQKLADAVEKIVAYQQRLN